MTRRPAGAATPSGMGSAALRRLNTSVALRAIVAMEGPVTLAQLTEATALSRRTVESILDQLVAARWVYELDERASTGGAGRPSRQFAARPDNALVAALRIDTYSATALVTDVLGDELGRAERVVPDRFDPHSSVATAAEALRDVIERRGLPADRIRGGCLALGGAVDENGVVKHLIHAPRWTDFDAPAALAGHLDVPWFADNDANLAALAEGWVGCAVDHDTFMWLISGNRSGAGFLVRGEIHRGFRGAAGELAEAAIYAQDIEYHPIALLTSPRHDERDVAHRHVAAARAGDRAALREVDGFVAAITPALVAITWIVAPPLIVLGGGLEAAADLLLPRLTAAMHEAGTPPIELRATVLDRDAPLRGAVKLALDRLDADLFGSLSLDARAVAR